MHQIISLGIGEFCANMHLAAQQQKWQEVFEIALDIEFPHAPVDILCLAGLGHGGMAYLGIVPVVWKDGKPVILTVVNNLPAKQP